MPRSPLLHAFSSHAVAPSDQKRRLIVLEGEAEDTGRSAADIVGGFIPSRVLWVSGSPQAPYCSATPRETLRWLGQSVDAVVVDLHDALEVDALGRCAGLVRGGGILLLRIPAAPDGPRGHRRALAPLPYDEDDVTPYGWHRFRRELLRELVPVPIAALLHGPAPAPASFTGTEEQRQLVDILTRRLLGGTRSVEVVLADRGRGKSSALGIALRASGLVHKGGVIVTGPSSSACNELLARAGPPGETPPFVAADVVAMAPGTASVVAIDEAAQLSVALLERIAHAHRGATLLLATTTRGYEGTGGGFVLRFLDWVAQQARPVTVHHLTAPIRWSADDVVEDMVHRALVLDAAPSVIDGSRPRRDTGKRTRRIEGEELAGDEELLRATFGLLLHAHPRTTPSDLLRLLDAPNLHVHVVQRGGELLAACLVAEEGALDATYVERMAAGTERVRGHALADTLVVHGAAPAAGTLQLLRSVRIAVHPDVRRQGVATELVQHIHESYHPDLFGTLFGATAELVRFRREVGYELVRVGVSRGARTGEPAAVMAHAASVAGRKLVEELRAELARSLPTQLALLAADEGVPLSASLERALLEAIPAPAPATTSQLAQVVERYLSTPQPVEPAAYAIVELLRRAPERLANLPTAARRLIELRLLQRCSWQRAATGAGFPHVGAAMKAMRPALATCLLPLLSLGIDDRVRERDPRSGE